MDAWQFVAGQPWAMTQAALEAVLSFASRVPLTPTDIAALHAGEAEAVSVRNGKPMENTRSVKIRDGVATIPVRGPIGRYASMFSDFSGGTSISGLATDLQAAFDNPAVRAIILDVNSPGGTVDGTGEMANLIYSARGRKPIVSYVGNLAASAAYYVASSADEVVIAPSASLGAIGVVAVVNPTKTGPNAPLEFASSQSPKKRLDPSTEAGQADIQEQLDAIADVFIGDVAKFRGTTPETVANDYGQGSVKVGQAAVDAGLADRLGSYESLHSELAKGKRPGQISQPGRMAAGSSGGSPTMTFAQRFKVVSWLFGSPKAEAAPDNATEPTEAPEDVDAFLESLARPQLAAGTIDAKFPEEKVREQIEAARAEERASAHDALAKVVRTQADAFIAAEVKAGRVLPADVNRLAVLYVDFAMADQSSPITATVDGKTEAYSRLSHFTAEIGQRGKHNLTEERIPADSAEIPAALKGLKLLPHADPDATRTASKANAETVLALLQSTSEGQAVLAEAKARLAAK